jgi:acetyl esterase/lipase
MLGSFSAGMLTSELPLHLMSLQAAATAVAVRRHGLDDARMSAGLALSCASSAGLIGLRLRAHTAPRVLEQALVEALGTDYRARIGQPMRPPSDGPNPRTPGAIRMLLIHRRYVHDADIPYGPAGRFNRMDLWRRADLPRDGRAPVLLQVHGGGWMWGNKRGQAYPLMAHLAERGWICASISYRLSPHATWPAQIVDVKRALAWIRDNIAAYGGDPGFIAITGGSAGGHLAALAALTANDPEYQPEFEEAETSVQAAVPFYGVYDWTGRVPDGHHALLRFIETRIVKGRREDNPELFDRASPMSRVRPDAPPTFLLHGTADNLLPVAEAREFAGMLRAVSRQPVAYAELPGAHHAFDLTSSVRAAAAAQAVACFLGVAYADYLDEEGRDPAHSTGS